MVSFEVQLGIVILSWVYFVCGFVFVKQNDIIKYVIFCLVFSYIGKVVGVLVVIKIIYMVKECWVGFNVFFLVWFEVIVFYLLRWKDLGYSGVDVFLIVQFGMMCKQSYCYVVDGNGSQFYQLYFEFLRFDF